MERYKKSRIIIIISTLLIVSASLLFLSSYEFLGVSTASRVLKQVVSHVESFFAKPTQQLTERKDFLMDVLEAYEENQELKSSLASIQDTLLENQTLKEENHRLREQLEMRDRYVDKQKVSAVVSVRTPHSWKQELSLNLGSNDGITEEMLAVANNGLIGTVESLTEDRTVIKLLTNSDAVTKIAVKISAGSQTIYGILTGYDTDSNSFIVGQLNSESAIPEGSQVVTSDLAGSTPSNVLVGKVRSVKTSTSDLNRELFVEPAADFSTISVVTMIGQ